MDNFHTPILFLVFNRPAQTKQVLAQIREIKPQQLFIAADGPRSDRPGEKHVTEEVRKIVCKVDWDCEVKTLFRSENLGCGAAVSEAITWFFDQVEEGIILEDDCLPNIHFFYFCEKMLEAFRNDESVMQISGTNFQFSAVGEACYYRTRIPHIWGWATWRRAWLHYDFRIKAFEPGDPVQYFKNTDIDLFWRHQFQTTKSQLHTWDYQWVHAIFSQKAFCIAPQVNLVKNIGYQAGGTNLSNPNDILSNMKTYDLVVPDELPVITYEPIADINEHEFFRWKMSPYQNETPSLKILNKIKKKLTQQIKSSR